MLVGPESLLRDLLGRALRQDARFALVAETSDEPGVAGLCAAWRPDLLVVEAAPGGPDPVSCAQAARRVSPGTAILVLTSGEDPLAMKLLMETGVQGFVNTHEPFEILEEGLVEVASGKTWLPAAVHRSQQRLQAHPDPAWQSLSRHEQKLLCYVARGWTSRAIAQHLGLSHRSVETYRYRMIKKLGVGNVAGLVGFAFRSGLVPACPAVASAA